MKELVVGEFYKLDEIRAELGGPLLASIATKDNKILYVKFKREKLNPKLPNEIWIKNGPIQMKAALEWTESAKPVPMFFKDPYIANGQWKYLGLKKAKVIYRGEDASKYSKDQSIGLVLQTT